MATGRETDAVNPGVLDHLAGNAIVGILVFQVVVLVLVLSNALVLGRPHRRRSSGPTPRVSLLVPARNEARNVRACVRALLAQTYPDLEVLVLDDRSEDGTRALLEAERARDGRLVVLEGEEPADGWTGKSWACHQLARAATGEVLLFADADTAFETPDAVTTIVRTLLASRADLLSGLPRQVLGTPGEALLVPMLYWALLSFTPLAVQLLWRRPPFARAVGQLMVFRRTAYDAVGGHAAVRHSVVDDIALARRVARAGLACRLMDATSLVRCRMYRGGREAADGFAKNLFPAFDHALVPYLFVWGWLGFAALEPIAVGVLHLALPGGAPLQPGLLGATISLTLVHWGVVLARTRLPIVLALLYPLTMVAFLTVVVRSLVDSLLHRTTWKGRPVVRRPTRST